jgi:hypothetical protein
MIHFQMLNGKKLTLLKKKNIRPMLQSKLQIRLPPYKYLRKREAGQGPIVP